MIKRILIFLLWFSVLLALFLPGLINDPSFVLGGSTSLYPLIQRLDKISKNFGISYYYNSLGSSAGLLRTQNGTFDIGFLSKEVPKKLPKNMKSFILAREGIIFVYHLPSSCKNKGKYANLSMKELQNIFLQKTAYWSNLKGFNCKDKTKIFRINREAGSGTRSVFEKKTNLKQKAKNNLYFFDHLSKHTGDLLKVIKKTPGTIGYMSFSYKNKIKNMKNSNINFFSIDNVIPNKTNFASGDYVFFRPFVGLYLLKNKFKIMNFLKFLDSPKSKKIYEELGLIYKLNLNKIYTKKELEKNN